MDLHVAFTDRRDLSRQIYRQIRAALLSGLLRPGQALPPSRELAARLAVARNTVGVAYDRLIAEGFVTSRVGAGTFVNSPLSVELPERPSTEAAVGDRNSSLSRAIWKDIPQVEDLSRKPDFDFRAGVPDAQLFPYEAWRRLSARELTPAAIGTGMYGDPAGHRGLRDAIANHIAVSRGVGATADDVVVTNGIQQALDLITRVLLEPGACVAFEEPGYLPARRVFEVHGARVVSVPVDADGLVVDALPADARLVYVTPSHQFPLGVVMSLRRRMQLLAWATRHGAVVVEDDYDTEFRYSGRPTEPLHSLDRTGSVIYLGSFSKVMLPILRLGFLIAPPGLHRDLRVARQVADWHSPLPTQAALARFIEDGLLARHIRRMRKEYQTRHERIRRVLASEFADAFEVIPSEVGLHLSVFAKKGTGHDLREVVQRAELGGVGLFDLRLFSQQKGRPGLVFGYGGITAARIDEGLRRLRRCLPSD